ncbi:carboxymuconolactone decarboxylase family protein [Modestobacter versicolor]|uniref:carboxymuconolactone decarboxylase family protein n=1 Tax=Modestobacter versicolor TaxID=429133 RepID=UPI0034DF66FC
MRQAGRLPWPAPDELDDAQRALHRALAGDDWSAGDSAVPVTDETGRLLGPFNTMVLSPAIGARVSELGVALRHRSSLTGRERELAVLCVAAVERSGFEWAGHLRPALAAGLSEGELRTLLDGRAPASATAREQQVHRLVTSLARHRDLSDEEFQEAVRTLGVVVVVELVWLVGYYALIALSLRVGRAPMPGGRPDPFAQPPPPTTHDDAATSGQPRSTT